MSPTVVSVHKPSPGITEFVCRMSAPLLQRSVDQRVTAHIKQRRSPSGILSIRYFGVGSPTNSSPCESPPVAGVLALPIIPNLVNHLHDGYVSRSPGEFVNGTNRVMEKEHGVYMESNRCQPVNGDARQQNCSPFGDHFGPL